MEEDVLFCGGGSDYCCGIMGLNNVEWYVGLLLQFLCGEPGDWLLQLKCVVADVSTDVYEVVYL